MAMNGFLIAKPIDFFEVLVLLAFFEACDTIDNLGVWNSSFLITCLLCFLSFYLQNIIEDL